MNVIPPGSGEHEPAPALLGITGRDPAQEFVDTHSIAGYSDGKHGVPVDSPFFWLTTTVQGPNQLQVTDSALSRRDIEIVSGLVVVAGRARQEEVLGFEAVRRATPGRAPLRVRSYVVRRDFRGNDVSTDMTEEAYAKPWHGQVVLGEGEWAKVIRGEVDDSPNVLRYYGGLAFNAAQKQELQAVRRAVLAGSPAGPQAA